MSHDLEQIWSRVQAQLALVVDEPTYRIWLEPLRRARASRRTPGRGAAHARDWIPGDTAACCRRASSSCSAPDTRRARGGRREPTRRRRAARAHATARTAPAAKPGQHRAPRRSNRAGPLGNPKLTFEQFVIGDCNRLAHAAALTVAEMPAQAYNPLFICGPPGVGKTHLLSSIANLAARSTPRS